MLALAFMRASALGWLYTRTKSKILLIFASAFFVLNPLIARYAVTVWKDVPFAGVMLLFSIFVFECVRTNGALLKSRSRVIQFGLLTAVVLLRSNGIFIVVAAIVVLVCVCSRSRKRIATFGFGVLLATVVCQSLVFGVLGVQSGYFSESISIPLQQISRTVVEDGTITTEQRDVIENVLPFDRIKELQRPDTPNTLKFVPDFNDDYLESHKVEFLLTWAGMLPSNVGSYARAWLDETKSYWNVDSSSWMVVEPGYDVYNEGSNSALSLLPAWVSEKGSLLAGEKPTNIARNLFSPLFSIGWIVWFMLFCLVVHLCLHRKASAAFYVPCVFCWATLLIAAPIVGEFRYVFALHVCLPFFFALLIYPIEQNTKYGWTSTDEQPSLQ